MIGNLESSRKERAEARRAMVQSAWVHIEKEMHWCLPPRWYPQPERGQVQPGPGSLWECPSCNLVWTSFDIWLDNDRENWPRGDMSIRPLFAVGRWRIADKDVQLPRERFNSEAAWQRNLEHIKTQEDSYDWRGINTLNSKFLRRLIEVNGGTWRDVLD